MGPLEQIIITTTLGSILGLLQLESALTRFYEYQANERKIYITSLLVFSGLLSLLITLILWVFAEEINQLIFNENTYIQAYKIGILSLPLLCLNSFFIVVIRFTSNRLFFIKAPEHTFFNQFNYPCNFGALLQLQIRKLLLGSIIWLIPIGWSYDFRVKTPYQ